MMERAGLARLIDACLDGNAIAARGLRPRPASDIPLEARGLLGVEPQEAVVFETTGVGLEAAHACGFKLIVGVDPTRDTRPLVRAAGAATVVENLGEILERSAASAPRRNVTSSLR